MCGSAALAGVILTLLTLGASPSKPGGTATAVPELTRLLGQDRWEVRFFAAEALGNIGPSAKAAIPALIERFKDPSEQPMVRASALKALGQMGSKANSAIPSMPRLLLDKDWLVRKSAAETLQRLGRGSTAGLPNVAPTVDRLLTDMDSDSGGRKRADAFQRLGQAPSDELLQIVPDVIGLLQDPRPDVRRQSADVLGSIGFDAHAAINAGQEVVAAIRTSQEKPTPPAVTKEESLILARLDKLKSILPSIDAALIPVLQDKEPSVRIAAAGALTRVNPHAAVPQLAHLSLSETHPGVRRSLAENLGTIGADTQNAAKDRQTSILALVEMLSDTDSNTRETAVKALAQIGPPATAALPKLKELLLSDDVLSVKAVALQAIDSIAGTPDSPSR